MTYDPYEAQDRDEEELAKRLDKLNLSEGWRSRTEGVLHRVFKTNPEVAQDLTELVVELLEAYTTRGDLIKECRLSIKQLREERGYNP